MPATRQSITHKFEVAGHEGYLTVGIYDDGGPGEMFITMAKEGSTVSGLMDTLATMTSIALQYGVPLRDLVSKFTHVRFEPSGFTGNPEVPIAKSIVDYIFRWMGSRFLSKDDRDALGIMGGEVVAEAPTEPSPQLGAFDPVEETFDLLRRVVKRSNRPLSVSLLEGGYGPMTLRWRDVLDWAAEASAAGPPIRAQVLSRAIGVMLGHELTLNPFYTTPSYQELESLSFDDKIAVLRQPEMRARILSEAVDPDPTIVLGRLVREFDHMFLLGDPPDYEQPFDQSIRALAQRANVTPEEFVYDLMLERDGHNMLYVTLCNYEYGSLESSLAMMRHPGAVLGLGDGGAHCGTICDGSFPTFMLSYWVRDRTRGERLSLSEAVRLLSRDSARAVGLEDRGVVAPGYKADLNVIDLDQLRLYAPEVAHDLPTGGRRLVQRADGYCATIVSGRIVHRNGSDTGELPGRLVRGPQAAPPNMH